VLDWCRSRKPHCGPQCSHGVVCRRSGLRRSIRCPVQTSVGVDEAVVLFEDRFRAVDRGFTPVGINAQACSSRSRGRCRRTPSRSSSARASVIAWILNAPRQRHVLGQLDEDEFLTAKAQPRSVGQLGHWSPSKNRPDRGRRCRQETRRISVATATAVRPITVNANGLHRQLGNPRGPDTVNTVAAGPSEVLVGRPAWDHAPAGRGLDDVSSILVESRDLQHCRRLPATRQRAEHRCQVPGPAASGSLFCRPCRASPIATARCALATIEP